MIKQIILNLTLLICTPILYAETIQINGAVSEFSCAADDTDRQCAGMYQLVAKQHEQKSALSDIQTIINQSESKAYALSMKILEEQRSAIILADYR